MTTLTKIKDVWNDIHYVRTEDLYDMRKTLMPLYKQDGTNKKSRQGFPVARWQNILIHRDNIATIEKTEAA